MDTHDELEQNYSLLFPPLNERQRHLVAAADAEQLGRGGIALVARVSGFSRPTLCQALRDLRRPPLPVERVRRPGAGRKRLTEHDPGLARAWETLIDPDTRGDPLAPLRWTCQSTRQLAQALARLGHPVSHAEVAQLLRQLGYRLQANAKTKEGKQHPDREAQFRYIRGRSEYFLGQRWPVWSVATKKQELVGDYAASGREGLPEGEPEEVGVHAFPDPQVPRAVPYGVYDAGHDLGWVSVGCSHDTARFAVESIRRWWQGLGQELYPTAPQVLSCADSGGSNGYRLRLWKVELQRWANAAAPDVTVCHYPPGTSKGNKLGHRLFSHIAMNWRGRPLLNYQGVVQLIAGTTTETGLHVQAALDPEVYPAKVKVSEDQMAAVSLHPHYFHGEWNYTIKHQRSNP